MYRKTFFLSHAGFHHFLYTSDLQACIRIIVSLSLYIFNVHPSNSFSTQVGAQSTSVYIKPWDHNLKSGGFSETVSDPNHVTLQSFEYEFTNVPAQKQHDSSVN